MAMTPTQPVQVAPQMIFYHTEPHSLGNRFSAAEVYRALTCHYYWAHRRNPHTRQTSYFAQEASRLFNKGWTRNLPRF